MTFATWRRTVMTLFALLGSACVSISAAAEPSADVVRQTLDAGGGEAKILRLFRMKESLVLGSDPSKKGSLRTTVVEPPLHWWQGTKDRVTVDKEPAVWLIYAWTLAALADDKSKLETLPDGEVEGRATYGIRVSQTITPPLDMHFDKETKRLASIEWRSDRHVFSDWKQQDGLWYPARCVGYKLKDGKRWYATEIVELERLDKLPDGLTR
jgi:hypothetical protein